MKKEKKFKILKRQFQNNLKKGKKHMKINIEILWKLKEKIK